MAAAVAIVGLRPAAGVGMPRRFDDRAGSSSILHPDPKDGDRRYSVGFVVDVQSMQAELDRLRRLASKQEPEPGLHTTNERDIISIPGSSCPSSTLSTAPSGMQVTALSSAQPGGRQPPSSGGILSNDTRDVFHSSANIWSEENRTTADETDNTHETVQQNEDGRRENLADDTLSKAVGGRGHERAGLQTTSAVAAAPSAGTTSPATRPATIPSVTVLHLVMKAAAASLLEVMPRTYSQSATRNTEEPEETRKYSENFEAADADAAGPQSLIPGGKRRGDQDNGVAVVAGGGRSGVEAHHRPTKVACVVSKPRRGGLKQGRDGREVADGGGRARGSRYAGNRNASLLVVVESAEQKSAGGIAIEIADAAATAAAAAAMEEEAPEVLAPANAVSREMALCSSVFEQAGRSASDMFSWAASLCSNIGVAGVPSTIGAASASQYGRIFRMSDDACAFEGKVPILHPGDIQSARVAVNQSPSSRVSAVSSEALRGFDHGDTYSSGNPRDNRAANLLLGVENSPEEMRARWISERCSAEIQRSARSVGSAPYGGGARSSGYDGNTSVGPVIKENLRRSGVPLFHACDAFRLVESWGSTRFDGGRGGCSGDNTAAADCLVEIRPSAQPSNSVSPGVVSSGGDCSVRDGNRRRNRVRFAEDTTFATRRDSLTRRLTRSFGRSTTRSASGQQRSRARMVADDPSSRNNLTTAEQRCRDDDGRDDDNDDREDEDEDCEDEDQPLQIAVTSGFRRHDTIDTPPLTVTVGRVSVLKGRG
ncbi:unnamed protein product, partial [Sphacelaria rigidula]